MIGNTKLLHGTNYTVAKSNTNLTITGINNEKQDAGINTTNISTQYNNTYTIIIRNEKDLIAEKEH